MLKAKKAVPRGYQAIMPYLRVANAANAIKFYKKVFGAKESYRLKMGPKIGHAEIVVGGAVVMLSDAFPDMGIAAPKGMASGFRLVAYVDDADKIVAKAVKAGAKLLRPVTDEFYGDRSGQICDPFGHIWTIQTRMERVTPKDMQKRLNDLMKAEKSAGAAKAAGGRGRKAGAKKAVRRKAAKKPAKATASRTTARKVARRGRKAVAKKR